MVIVSLEIISNNAYDTGKKIKSPKYPYHRGDVLNTTSRIEGKCNELNQNLLISADMLNYIKFDNDFIVEEKGEIELRG